MRPILSLSLIAFLVCGSVGLASANEATGAVVLKIQNVSENPRGTIRCGLYERSSWMEPERAVQWVDATYTDAREAICRFEGIESGTYGIGVFHDSDDDHDMDSNVVGIPSEGVCASNDPEANMGPPAFDDAKFRHEGERTEVACTMNY